MRHIAWSLLSLLFAASFVQQACAADAPAKPNVIIFLADDEGYGELGCQGNKEIPTPNIDSIAANGIRFTNGYVSGPYCSPTRAGLMTGRYQTRFGHEWNPGGARSTAGLPVTETTVANRMKDLGYATCAIGKWHLGEATHFHPMKRGFDEFFGTLANTSFFDPKLFVDSRISPDVRKIDDESFYTTDEYAKRAVDWIEKNKAKPFFLYFPFNAQHAPLQAPQKYLDKFAHIQDEKRRLFAAMMHGKDAAIGRVLDTLRQNKLEERTLVFYLADNGGPTASTTSKNDPLRGFKATTSDGGIRVPFMVQWKGQIPAGKIYGYPVIQLDILPTAIAAAGGQVKPEWKLDGVNLLPYLKGENSARPHETLYWRFGEQWAIRDGDWKLVASRIDNNKPRLINFAQDISEANDLIDKNPEKASQLKAKWDKWNAELAEPLWVPGDNAKKKAGKKKKA